MAFDGIITRAAAHELSEVIVNGRIDKIYEPEPDSIVLNIRTMDGVVRLLASCHSAGASLRLITSNPENPKEPFPFCMLLRKHIQGSKIVSLEQRGAERIIEMTLERLNELGLMVQKKLIFEIMGKYSNIVLVDMSRRSAKPGHAPAFGFGITDTADTADVPGISAINSTDSPDQMTGATYTTGAAGCMILGSIKGIPSGLSRVREVLPGRLYEYPPQQDKIPFDVATADDCRWKAILHPAVQCLRMQMTRRSIVAKMSRRTTVAKKSMPPGRSCQRSAEYLLLSLTSSPHLGAEKPGRL